MVFDYGSSASDRAHTSPNEKKKNETKIIRYALFQKKKRFSQKKNKKIIIRIIMFECNINYQE